MIKAVRWVLGQLILFLDWITRPRPMQRSPEAQAAVDARTRELALYQFQLCPFCVKVRRAMRRLNLNIETRDALNDPQHRTALEAGGGEIKVPCLAIKEGDCTRWMYESNDIIAWLEQEFGSAPQGNTDAQ